MANVTTLDLWDVLDIDATFVLNRYMDDQVNAYPSELVSVC